MPSSSPPDLTLTASERTRFNQAVTLAGLQSDDCWAKQIAIGASGTFAAGDITTTSVANVAALNAMIGINPAIFQQPGRDNVISYPPAITGDDGKSLTTRETFEACGSCESAVLKKSMDAMLFGNPARVAANAELVDAAYFPLALSVIAAQSLVLNDGVTLTLGPGFHLIILGSLMIGAGASISSSVDTVINTQVAYSAND